MQCLTCRRILMIITSQGMERLIWLPRRVMAAMTIMHCPWRHTRRSTVQSPAPSSLRRMRQTASTRPQAVSVIAVVLLEVLPVLQQRQERLLPLSRRLLQWLRWRMPARSFRMVRLPHPRRNGRRPVAWCSTLWRTASRSRWVRGMLLSPTVMEAATSSLLF